MKEKTVLFEHLKSLIYKDADKAEDEIRKIDPTSGVLPLEAIVELYISLGAHLEILDFPERAINVLRKGLELSVDDDDKAECLRYIGDSLVKLEKYNEAIDAFNKVLSLAKDQYLIASAYNGLGVVYRDMSEYEKSITYSEEALKHYNINDKSHLPEYYWNFTNIIACYLLLDKKEEADKYINDLFTRKDARNDDLSYIYYYIGHYYYKRKEWGRALENYKNALIYYDRNDMEVQGDRYWYIGSCYHNLGELDKARENYEKALELKKDPSDRKDIQYALNMIINKK